jgi:hypothetical protein
MRDEQFHLLREILKARLSLREVLPLRHEAGSDDSLSDCIEREHCSPQLLSHLSLAHVSFLSRWRSTTLPKERTAQTPRTPPLPRTPKGEKCPDAPFRVLVGKGWQKGEGGKRGLRGKVSLYT